MSDFNFITSIAGLNSSINVNESISILLSSASDNPVIKSVIAPEGVLTELTDIPILIGKIGIVLVHNIDESNDVVVRLEDTVTTTAIDKRIPVGGFIVISSAAFDVSPTGSAFATYNDTLNKVSVEGLDGDAKVKLIYIPI